MTLLFIAHDAKLFGAPRSMVNLIQGLKKKGVNSIVILPENGPLVSLLDKHSIPYYIENYYWWAAPNSYPSFLRNPIGFLRKLKSSCKKGLRNLRVIPKMMKIAKNHKVDYIISNTSVISVGAILSFRTGIPHIWHIREFVDLDHKLIFDWGEKLMLYFLRKSYAQVFVSKTVFNHFKRKTKLNNPFVVHNSIAFKEDFDRRLENRKSVKSICCTSFTFLVLGRFGKSKGQESIIESFAVLCKEFNHIRLIIGGGNYPTDIEEILIKADIHDKVILPGFIEDTEAMYMDADCYIMSSKNEAFGRVTVEAMSFGLPVIALNRGGTMEIIQDEITGFLYSDNDDLVNKMKMVILKPERGIEIGLKGWEVAKEKFNIDVYADSFMKVINNG
jgi:glycosyltransferase involved in cell wall biosynthesis